MHSGIDSLDFGLPSLKYSYTLHAQFRVSKPVIIIDSCVLVMVYICNSAVSLKLPRPRKIVFHVAFTI